MINWFRVEQPFENAKPEDKYITIFDEIDKQYDFRGQPDVDGPAHFIVYTSSH